MTVKSDVLKMLENNKDKALSGEAIAQKLNVSRAAVWKAVKSLKENGYEIEAVNNKGYKLLEKSDILSVPAIKNFLKEDISLVVLNEVDSTNTYAKKLAVAEGAADKTAVVSESQTKGRGRLGRKFFSPEKSGLYMSLILRPEMTAEESLFITIGAAVAVCRAIEKQTTFKPKIKWVNDIFLNGKKVCGILTEAGSSIENRMLEYVVLGIGVNVKHTDFPEDLKDIAGSIESEDNISRNRLCADIINEFLEIYKNPNREALIKEYKEKSLILGKEIEFIKNGIHYEGKASDINSEGNLVVETKDGKEVLNSGEVSLRSKNYAKR